MRSLGQGHRARKLVEAGLGARVLTPHKVLQEGEIAWPRGRRGVIREDEAWESDLQGQVGFRVGLGGWGEHSSQIP